MTKKSSIPINTGRRSVLQGMGAVVAGSLLSAPRVQAADDTLVFCGFGGSVQDQLREWLMVPFTKATGIRVIDTGPPDTAKLKAMVEAGRVEWDVVQLEADFIPRGRLEKFLEKLDYNVISKKDILPDAINDYGIIWQFGATIIAYRTDKYAAGTGPKSWADFWDVQRFPGRRALSKQTYHTFPAALAADGVPRDKLYPIDVDRVFRSLDRIRPHIVKFFDGMPQAQQMIASKEVDMTSSTSARMGVLQRQGLPIYIEMNQGIPFGDAFVVPRGAPHKEAAMRFIDSVMQNEKGSALKARGTYSAMANTRVDGLLDPETKKLLVTTPENYSRVLKSDDAWWSVNRPKMDQLMNDWLLKG